MLTYKTLFFPLASFAPLRPWREVFFENVKLGFISMGISFSEADMRLVLVHTKTIMDFLQKEIPELSQ